MMMIIIILVNKHSKIVVELVMSGVMEDLAGFKRKDCHPLPLRGVVDGTRTRKPRAYLVSWFILPIYFAH